MATGGWGDSGWGDELWGGAAPGIQAPSKQAYERRKHADDTRKPWHYEAPPSRQEGLRALRLRKMIEKGKLHPRSPRFVSSPLRQLPLQSSQRRPQSHN